MKRKAQMKVKLERQEERRQSFKPCADFRFNWFSFFLIRVAVPSSILCLSFPCSSLSPLFSSFHPAFLAFVVELLASCSCCWISSSRVHLLFRGRNVCLLHQHSACLLSSLFFLSCKAEDTGKCLSLVTVLLLLLVLHSPSIYSLF